MATMTSADPKKVMRQNLAFLKEYANRVILEGDTSLSPLQDVKDSLIREFWASGAAFNLTERDLAVLLYRGLLPQV
ncbi:MAG: hypothetical protein ACE5Q6_14615 [Dehalococcoidia bacterium]